MSSRDATKFKCDLLRDAATAGSSEVFTVIVELDVPMPWLVPVPAGEMHASRPRFRFGSESDDRTEASVEAEFRTAYESLTGSGPGRYVRASKSFAVSTTGAHLASLARMRSVAAIWPNTVRRR